MLNATKAILVVEPDLVEGTRICETLEAAGYPSMWCPGPSEPEYTCVGARTGVCALTAAAEVVVLDLQLRSDDAMEGVPGWGLLSMYLERGAKVVTLVSPSTPVGVFPHQDIAVVERPVHPDHLLAAVRRLVTSLHGEQVAR